MKKWEEICMCSSTTDMYNSVPCLQWGGASVPLLLLWKGNSEWCLDYNNKKGRMGGRSWLRRARYKGGRHGSFSQRNFIKFLPPGPELSHRNSRSRTVYWENGSIWTRSWVEREAKTSKSGGGHHDITYVHKPRPWGGVELENLRSRDTWYQISKATWQWSHGAGRLGFLGKCRSRKLRNLRCLNQKDK